MLVHLRDAVREIVHIRLRAEKERMMEGDALHAVCLLADRELESARVYRLPVLLAPAMALLGLRVIQRRAAQRLEDDMRRQADLGGKRLHERGTGRAVEAIGIVAEYEWEVCS